MYLMSHPPRDSLIWVGVQVNNGVFLPLKVFLPPPLIFFPKRFLLQVIFIKNLLLLGLRRVLIQSATL